MTFLIPLLVLGGGVLLVAASSSPSSGAPKKSVDTKGGTDKEKAFLDEPFMGEVLPDTEDKRAAFNLRAQAGILRALLRHGTKDMQIKGKDKDRWETDLVFSGGPYVDPGVRALQFVTQALLAGKEIYAPIGFAVGGTARALPVPPAEVRGLVAVPSGYAWDPMELSYYARLMMPGVPQEKIEFLGKAPGAVVEADIAQHDL